jgi:hypothetical protein
MPTESGTAYIVDPMGHAPEALDEKEFEQVQRFLIVLRDDKQEPLQDAIEWLLRRSSDTPMDDQGVIAQALWSYANDRPQETIGVLARVFADEDARFKNTEDLSAEEIDALQWALAAIRAGGWFAEWLKIQLCSVACNPTDPKYHHPTPLQIASTLTEFIREHEDRLDAARELVGRRPDLLFPASAEPQATPETSVGAHTSKQPTKAPRARKPRKKASHAA